MSDSNPSLERRVAQLEIDLAALATDVAGIKHHFNTIKVAVDKAGDEFKLIFSNIQTNAVSGKKQVDAFKAQTDRIAVGCSPAFDGSY